MQFTEEGLLDWGAQLRDLRAIEKVMNHVHMYDLFADGDISESCFLIAAHVVKRAWELSLATAFPARRFVVAVSNDEADYGPTVTFWTER